MVKVNRETTEEVPKRKKITKKMVKDIKENKQEGWNWQISESDDVDDEMINRQEEELSKNDNIEITAKERKRRSIQSESRSLSDNS